MRSLADFAPRRARHISLTSWLKQPDVAAAFEAAFPTPAFAFTQPMLAPPVTTHYALVGTAFDYLLRFQIEVWNRDGAVVTDEWVAEEACNHFAIPPDLIEEYEETELVDEFHMSPTDAAHARSTVACLGQAKEDHARCLTQGTIDDRLIRSTLRLAQLDDVCRKGIFHNEKIDEGDVEDLRALLAIVEPNIFKTQQVCVLNPTFHLPVGARIVGDADLIIGDALIDIKATKRLEFTSRMYHQLIGYYCLAHLYGIRGSSLAIEKLGIYFARHAVLHTCETIDPRTSSHFPAFLEWFKTHAEPLRESSTPG